MNLVTGKLHDRRKVILGVSLMSLLAIPLAACSGTTTGQSPLLPTEPAAVVSSSEETGVPVADSLNSVITPDPAPPATPAAPLTTEPRIIAEPTLAKASFQITDLVFTPAEVQPGGQIIVTANLTNSGTSEGSDEIELKINGITQVVKEVTLPAGVTQELYFSGYMMPGAEPGTYTADLEGLTAQFVVSAPVETLILSSPDPSLEPVAPVSSQTTPSCCGSSSSSGSSCGCGISSNTTSSRGGCGCGG
jgi:hypothetical protein